MFSMPGGQETFRNVLECLSVGLEREIPMYTTLQPRFQFKLTDPPFLPASAPS